MYNNLCAKREGNKADAFYKTHPTIVNPRHTPSGHYGSVAEQYTKLEFAKTIDYDCAVESCSWGLFQTMGIYYAYLYSSPREMEEAMNMCELQQFEIFIQEVKHKHGLVQAIKDHNWEKVATLYNGSGWRSENPDYANDLEKYYQEFKK